MISVKIILTNGGQKYYKAKLFIKFNKLIKPRNLPIITPLDWRRVRRSLVIYCVESSHKVLIKTIDVIPNMAIFGGWTFIAPLGGRLKVIITP